MSADMPDSRAARDDRPEHTRRKISAGTISGGALVASTIVTAVLHYKQVFLYLPRETAGVWLLFWSFGSYLAFFDLGIGPTLSREIAFLSGMPVQERLRSVADLFASCLRLYVIIAACLLLAATVAGWLFLPRLKLSAPSDPVLLASWSLFAAGSCINLLGNISYAVLTGEGQVAAERITRAVTMLIWLAISAATLMTGHGLLGLSAAWFCHACASRLIAVGAVRVFVPDLRLRSGSWDTGAARRLARPSTQWALTQLGALLILQTDNVVIAWNLGAAAIPTYEATAKVVTAVGTIALLRTNASVPYYSRAASASDIPALRHLLDANVRHALLVMAAAMGFMASFGQDVFQVWLGAGNFVGYPLLFVMLVMMTLETHHVSHANLVMATGRIPFVRPAFIAGVLNLAISLALVRWLGALGVALGTMIAQIATNNWYAPYLTLRQLEVPIARYLRGVLPFFFLFAAGFALAQAALSALLGERSSMLRLAAGMIIGTVLYVAAARRKIEPSF